MKTIKEYEIHPTSTGQARIEMPKGAKILGIAPTCARRRTHLLAYVNTDAPLEARLFSFHEGGENLENIDIEGYVGTIPFNASFFHIFVRRLEQ
jgi:hypothetical protein